MTPAQLTAIMPFAATRAVIYAPLLTTAMAEFEIETPRRQAAFLAHVAHESGSLKYVRESSQMGTHTRGALIWAIPEQVTGSDSKDAG